ncbi:MAG: phosphoenolpyruvate hydrolase family protein [Planctomycetia bacterium]|nr:phosphoenolpyruvate hydrolase family protein [Planctomycetia bacterium]
MSDTKSFKLISFAKPSCRRAQGVGVFNNKDAYPFGPFSAGIVGFYGASSMERLPVEPAIRDRVREFTEMKFSKE